MAKAEQFQIRVSDADLEDLFDRLANARWPEKETVNDWAQGIPLSVVRDLVTYWLTTYDWRDRERRLNQFPHYRLELDSLKIHFLHVRSQHENATPLLLSHGWPGSVVEFLAVVDSLVNPLEHGGRAEDAFHVICPSLPGYGFSDKPSAVGWDVHQIARTWRKLMAHLGYQKFIAAGSDWGTSISTSIGRQFPGDVIGLHLVPPLASPDFSNSAHFNAAERAAVADLARGNRTEAGYSAEHSTKPQTLGYGLVDSPVALCAWIAEKFWAWTDNGGDLYSVISRDVLLDNIMLYWLTQTGASSIRLYWESFEEIWNNINVENPDKITVPVAASLFPRENQRVSRRWAAKRFTHILYWNELSRGGHFPAMEQPDLFVDELRASRRAMTRPRSTNDSGN